MLMSLSLMCFQVFWCTETSICLIVLDKTVGVLIIELKSLRLEGR
jgi:hypothetical protein